MLFHGPPGVGKTMLAERVPGLLPELGVGDALEVQRCILSPVSISPTD
jgi:magnesium chelatase family protein